MNLKETNKGVFFSKDSIMNVGHEDIEYLKNIASNNKRKQSRLCAHLNEEDLLHEMIIIHTNSTYVRPHKHLKRSESFYILEGTADVVIFDEGGGVSQVI